MPTAATAPAVRVAPGVVRMRPGQLYWWRDGMMWRRGPDTPDGFWMIRRLLGNDAVRVVRDDTAPERTATEFDLALAGAPPGYQFDAVSITSSVTVSATSAASATTVVTGNAVTYNGSDSIEIEFFCPYLYLSTNTAGKGLYLWLFDGSTQIGNLGYQNNPTTSDLYAMIGVQPRMLTPTAAAHTYSIRASKDSGGTTVMQVAAGAGGAGAAMPAFIRITKV